MIYKETTRNGGFFAVGYRYTYAKQQKMMKLCCFKVV